MKPRTPHPFPLQVLAALLLVLWSVSRATADIKDFSFSGMGWVQYGRVVHSTVDTLARDKYEGNAVQSSGAQISLKAQVSEKLGGAVGLGVLENHALAGNSSYGRVPMFENPYIAEARFTYAFQNEEHFKLSLTGGLFPYNYNPDIKNLGLYLLRGPVYPGVILSGFEIKPVLPIANTLGFQLHLETGALRQDFILNSETDLYPFYDVSPAYIANYRPLPGLQLGGGVNFYRYLSIEPKLTSPDHESLNDRDYHPESKGGYPYNRVYIFVDTVTHDTTYLSFKGIKIMANASWDPKSLLGGEGIFGPEDLKVYGEAALMGLDNSKAYREVYGDLVHRMPVMLGFNLPAFRLLDNLSLEVEWYGAKFRDDLGRYQGGRGDYTPSPLPVSNFEVKNLNVETNQRRDNWKWSLYGSRKIHDHFKISFQAANDHFRPGGVVLSPSYESILSTPKDWYWMTKIAYFF